MHRFTIGDYLLRKTKDSYLLRKTKDRTLLITSKRRMLQLKVETAHTPYLGGYFLLTTERMSLNTSKEDICNVKGEMVETASSHTWRV